MARSSRCCSSAAGSVLHATGTREMSRLGGLWRAMPWTAGLFALGSVAVSGLPPLNGFVSEWLVYLGLFDAVTSKGPSAWAAMPAAIMLAMAGAVAMASFAKAGAMIFLGAPRTQAAAKAHECGTWMRGPMLVLAGVCVMIGLAPILFWPAVARADRGVASRLGIGGSARAVGHAGFGSRGAGDPGFGGGGVAVAEGARERLASRPDMGLRLRDTGRADAIHQRLFCRNRRRLVSPGCCDRERKLRRPRGYFPAEAIRLERVPETVLERIIAPGRARPSCECPQRCVGCSTAGCSSTSSMWWRD